MESDTGGRYVPQMPKGCISFFSQLYIRLHFVYKRKWSIQKWHLSLAAQKFDESWTKRAVNRSRSHFIINFSCGILAMWPHHSEHELPSYGIPLHSINTHTQKGNFEIMFKIRNKITLWDIRPQFWNIKFNYKKLSWNIVSVARSKVMLWDIKSHCEKWNCNCKI